MSCAKDVLDPGIYVEVHSDFVVDRIVLTHRGLAGQLRSAMRFTNAASRASLLHDSARSRKKHTVFGILELLGGFASGGYDWPCGRFLLPRSVVRACKHIFVFGL